MSKDIFVLIPNGRRMKVRCTPDTSFLQVLENVCEKHGYQPSKYDLKHHNIIVDLTSTMRFCNIPNKAILEMVEAERTRVESNVTVGLLLIDGERRTAEFSPQTSLYDLVMSLASNELTMLKNPTIMYMRQEVTGVLALKQKTLRHLGLIAGRAVLRLLDKTETEQANVSSVYRAKSEKNKEDILHAKDNKADLDPSCLSPDDNKVVNVNAVKNYNHKVLDPVKMIKSEKEKGPTSSKIHAENITTDVNMAHHVDNINFEEAVCSKQIENKKLKIMESPEELERRLRIEEEVTFVGSQKAVAFKQPEEFQDELLDLPDDFYELSIEEVRKIYHQLQQKCTEFEETPLMTTAKREELEKQVSQQKINTYKNVVVRIQFPDNIILQGVFTPTDTVQDVNDFVKVHLQNNQKPFQIFTTPLKETLDPKTTLLDAKFVPCVHMHFRWLEDNSDTRYLKDEIYLKQTSSDAAGILASKYRAPTRRKFEDIPGSSQSGQSKISTTKESKVPKWFKK
ncbi:unnamed protein product [Leptosia nina]|uniref:Tether containing UBX domain for GLUT4 n=1 Tax=Leptosia nina TaxID=320188 RepID=A0AAV1K6N8_9NEOP